MERTRWNDVIMLILALLVIASNVLFFGNELQEPEIIGFIFGQIGVYFFGFRTKGNNEDGE